jgi:hypothetical protein
VAVTPRMARPKLAKASRHLAVAVNLVPRAVAHIGLRTHINQDTVRPREHKEHAAAEENLHGVSNLFQPIDFNSIFTS